MNNTIGLTTLNEEQRAELALRLAKYSTVIVRCLKGDKQARREKEAYREGQEKWSKSIEKMLERMAVDNMDWKFEDFVEFYGEIVLNGKVQMISKEVG